MAEDEGSASTSRRPLMLRHRSWRRRWRVGEFSSYVVGLLLVLIVLMQPPSSAAAVVDTATSATREATSSAWNSSHHNATASSDYLSVNATHQYGSKSNTTNTSINATAMVEPLPNGVTMCDGSDPIGVSAAYLLQQPLYYCMHYGKCVANFTQHPDQPCLCSSKYTGPHCEFRTGREPSDCTKHCFWGTCQNGAKSFEIAMNDYATPDDLQYCLCPPTASGEYCEREAQPCADGSHCLNGGTCVTVTTTTTAAAGRSSDNSLEGAEAYCDCTTAYTGPEAFEGVHCEHKVTTFCSDEVDANGHHWCTNGGTCRENSTLGCTCPTGYSGPLCEFQNIVQEYGTCNLECQNGGVCRKGAKDVSFLARFGLDGTNRRFLQNQKYATDAFEHCVCPRGYAGVMCEYELEVCPGQSHVCMHGGSCVVQYQGQTTEVSCDCSTAEGDLYRYTGPFCEIRSTSFCTTDGEKTPSGSGRDAFCTNGGLCNQLVEAGQPHPGCTCSHGFSGPHCEDAETSNSSRSTYLAVGVVLGLCGLLAVLVLVLLYRRRRRRRLRRLRRTFSTSKGYLDAAPPPTMDHIQQLDSWVNSKMNLHDMGGKRVEEDVDTRCSDSVRGDGSSCVVTNATFHHVIVTRAHKGGQSCTASVTATNIGSDYSAATNFSSGYSIT